MEEFKIKFRGETLRVVQLTDDEIIDRYTLYANVAGDTPITKLTYHESNVIGDKVGSHPDRIYVRVLSPVWRNVTSKEDVSHRMSWDARQ